MIPVYVAVPDTPLSVLRLGESRVGVTVWSVADNLGGSLDGPSWPQ